MHLSDSLADIAIKLKRSEEHTSELQSHSDIVCRLLLENKKTTSTRECSTSSKSEARSQDSMKWTRSSSSSAVRCSRTKRSTRRRSRFFFNDTATTEIYTLSLHDALPI